MSIPTRSAKIHLSNSAVVPLVIAHVVDRKWGFWDIDLWKFSKLEQFFLPCISQKKQKIKIKNKNLRKYKIKKFIFFKSKLEQEIKIRKNPEIQKIIQKILKSFQKNLSLFDRFSFTHSLTWNNH